MGGGLIFPGEEKKREKVVLFWLSSVMNLWVAEIDLS